MLGLVTQKQYFPYLSIKPQINSNLQTTEISTQKDMVAVRLY